MSLEVFNAVIGLAGALLGGVVGGLLAVGGRSAWQRRVILQERELLEGMAEHSRAHEDLSRLLRGRETEYVARNTPVPRKLDRQRNRRFWGWMSGGVAGTALEIILAGRLQGVLFDLPTLLFVSFAILTTIALGIGIGLMVGQQWTAVSVQFRWQRFAAATRQLELRHEEMLEDRRKAEQKDLDRVTAESRPQRTRRKRTRSST